VREVATSKLAVKAAAPAIEFDYLDIERRYTQVECCRRAG